MNRILCPVDFSEASLLALEYATQIAEKHDSSLKIVHVVTDSEYNEELNTHGEKAFDILKEEISSKLGALALEINDSTVRGYEICSYEVLFGDFVEKIIEIIEKENTSMVVMGTYGAKDVSEARMGSNTVKVMNKSTVPVLCIPSKAEYYDFERIVYGSELDENDRLMLQQVINFALPYDSHLYLVHVAEDAKKKDRDYKKYADEIKTYFSYRKMEVEELRLLQWYHKN